MTAVLSQPRLTIESSPLSCGFRSRETSPFLIIIFNLFHLLKPVNQVRQEGHFHKDNAMTIGLSPHQNLINIAQKKIIASSFHKNSV